MRVQTPDGQPQARIAVHDEGVGIPVSEQPHIWEHHYQLEGTAVQSGSQMGVGMGLYISKAIVEGHHGHVGVESAPGKGTTIWFMLPLASPPASQLITSSPQEPAHGSGPASVPAHDQRAATTSSS